MRRSPAEFGTVAKKHLCFRVFDHRAADKNFVLIAIVNPAVLAERARRKKGRVGEEISYAVLGIASHKHRGVFRRNHPARRIGGNFILRKQRKRFDAVRHHLDIFEFAEIFGNAVRRRRSVEKDNIPVFNEFNRRKGDFFLFEKILVNTKSKARRGVVRVAYLCRKLRHKGETNSLTMIKAENGKGKGVQHVSLDFERPTLTRESLAE